MWWAKGLALALALTLATAVTLNMVVGAWWVWISSEGISVMRASGKEMELFHRSATVQSEEWMHECSAMMVDKNFLLTTYPCLKDAGELLNVSVRYVYIEPGENEAHVEDHGIFHGVVRMDEAAIHDSSDVVMIKMPHPVDIPKGPGGGRYFVNIECGENNVTDIVEGDIVFVPDAWEYWKYRKMTVGPLDDCGSRGGNLTCAIWKGKQRMNASSVGGPVFKKVGGPGGDYVMAGIVRSVGEASGGGQPVTIINIAFARRWIREVIEKQNLWVPLPPGQVPAFTLIPSETGPGCKGILIKGRWVLTAAHCIDAIGPNPKVIVGAVSLYGPHTEHGEQELTAERAIVHPKWSRNYLKGYDIALLKLPRSLNVPSPTLVDAKRAGVPSYTEVNSPVYGYKLGSGLEAVEFKVVDDSFVCTGAGALAANMFCAHLWGATLTNGCSGAPVMRCHDTVGSETGDRIAEARDPTLDLLVGIVSCTDYSQNNSGIGVVDISEPDVILWMRGVMEGYEDESHWKWHGLTIHLLSTSAIALALSLVFFRPERGAQRFMFCCVVVAVFAVLVLELVQVIAKRLKDLWLPLLLFMYCGVLNAATTVLVVEFGRPGVREALEQILSTFFHIFGRLGRGFQD